MLATFWQEKLYRWMKEAASQDSYSCRLYAEQASEKRQIDDISSFQDSRQELKLGDGVKP